MRAAPAIALLFALSVPGAAAAVPQNPTGPPARAAHPHPLPPEEVEARGPLRLYLDCERYCDRDFLTRELTFVDHVRDSQSADVHALVTTEPTGGGGISWRIQFIGQGRFEGHDESVGFTTQQTATDDERRQALLRWLQLGLATHAAIATGRTDLEVSHTAPDAVAVVPASDPWNAWVFSLSMNGHFSGEATSRSANHRFNASASRVTEAWKLNLRGNWRRSTNEFDVEDGAVKSLTSGWESAAVAVRSLGAQWSAAARVTAAGSTFENYDLHTQTQAGLEYDFFPYAESTRRSLTLTYLLGLATYDFQEVTIFDKLSERKAEHQLAAGLGLRQPWGSIGARASFSQHLDDLSRTRLNVFGDADVRLFRGFSLNLFGEYSRIRDQINLRKSVVAEEEILLRLRQLETGYSYFVGFGVTYRFGSIYNNVVNPRFRHF